MNFNKLSFYILLIVFCIFLKGNKAIAAEEDISIWLSDKIAVQKIPYGNKLPQCKKIWLLEKTGEHGEPLWVPNFFKTLKKELKKLGYEIVSKQQEADCILSPIFFFDSLDSKDAYLQEECSMLNIDKDENFAYLCSLSTVFMDTKGMTARYPEGIVENFMAYCGVRKEFPVDDKNIYTKNLGRIYSFLLGKMLPEQER